MKNKEIHNSATQLTLAYITDKSKKVTQLCKKMAHGIQNIDLIIKSMICTDNIKTRLCAMNHNMTEEVC